MFKVLKILQSGSCSSKPISQLIQFMIQLLPLIYLIQFQVNVVISLFFRPKYNIFIYNMLPWKNNKAWITTDNAEYVRLYIV